MDLAERQLKKGINSEGDSKRWRVQTSSLSGTWKEKEAKEFLVKKEVEEGCILWVKCEK